MREGDSELGDDSWSARLWRGQGRTVLLLRALLVTMNCVRNIYIGLSSYILKYPLI
jgi:hypothetical protein